MNNNIASVAKYAMDKGVILSTIRTMQSTNRFTVVVEGMSDRMFIYRGISLNDMVDVYFVCNSSHQKNNNKKDVLSIAEAANGSRYELKKFICFVDLDYDSLANRIRQDCHRLEYINYSKEANEFSGNDVESSLFYDEAAFRSIYNKIIHNSSSISIDEVRENIRRAASSIGAFRAANDILGAGLSLCFIHEDRTYSYYSESDIIFRWEDYVQHLMHRRSNITLVKRIESLASSLYNLHGRTGNWELCRGHDLTLILYRYICHNDMFKDIYRGMAYKKFEDVLRDVGSKIMAQKIFGNTIEKHYRSDIL